MQAIQSMHSANFLAYSYVLADSPAQVQQVYNAAFQQNIHHDAGKWHEAKVKNPDSEFAYPLPVYGFQAMSDRSKQQQSHLNNLVAAADNAKTQVNNLKAHTERTILTELQDCEKRNSQLSMQLSKLMLSIELQALQNCKASVDFSRHRELLEKLEKVGSALSGLSSKLQQIKGSQKTINDIAAQSLGPVGASTPVQTGDFVPFKESVNAKLDAVYNAVLDRCRSVSAQAIHERLNSRSNDYLAQLKRQYIAGDNVLSTEAMGDVQVKFRTMNSYEISICRLLAGVSGEVFTTVTEVGTLAAYPPLLSDLWSVTAHICGSKSGTPLGFLRASIEFLESKFAEEVSGSSAGFGRVSKVTDKRSALYAYCRQRVSIRSGDVSWIWFAVFCAFRAGWPGTLREIAQDKGKAVEGLELVCSVLANVIEGQPNEADATKLNAIMDASRVALTPEEELNNAYKWILVAVCKGDYESVRIAQHLPECNAFDWIWLGLRNVAASSDYLGKLQDLRAKIDALPINYFSSGDQMPSASAQRQLYPTLGDALHVPGSNTGSHKIAARSASSEQTRSGCQLALLHFLTLDFQKGIQTALKTANETFDMNDPFHRTALFISMALDKFGPLQVLDANNLKGSFDASGVVLEAALTVAVVQERNLYASAVGSNTGKKVTQQLGILDKRREAQSPSTALIGR